MKIQTAALVLAVRTKYKVVENMEILAFKSVTCGPCKMITPILDQISEELDIEITTIMVDTTEGRNEAAMYGVSGVPTLFFLKDGNILDKLVGYRSKKDILEKIEYYSR